MPKLKKHAGPAVARRALGVDIGADSLRLVCLADRHGAPDIEWVAVAPLSDDAVKEGVVVKRREVAAQLRRVLREHRCAVAAAAVGIPVDQVVVRWIDLPQMNAETLAAATPFEARKYLTYPPDQAEIVISPLRSEEGTDGANMRSLLVATPRDVVGSRAEAVEMAGLRVACMEIEPFALVRALDRPGRWRSAFWHGQSQGYLQLGLSASGLYVMQDAAPRFVRSIPWGSERLIEAVKDSRNCTLAQARAGLENREAALDENGGLVWEERPDINASGSVNAELDRLCREIERLLSYYRSLYAERSYPGALSRLILCGDAGGIRGLDRYLARALQLQVSAEHPFQTLTCVNAGCLPDTAAGREDILGVACGLALGQWAQETYTEHAGGNERRELIWRNRAA